MKLYVTGAVTTASENSMKKYKAIKTAFAHLFNEINTPLDTSKFTGTNEERFNKATSDIKEASIIIADVSNPSSGQGMELMLAHMLNIPVICVAEKGKKVSGLIYGAFKEVFFFSSIEELIIYLDTKIKTILNSNEIKV